MFCLVGPHPRLIHDQTSDVIIPYISVYKESTYQVPHIFKVWVIGNISDVTLVPIQDLLLDSCFHLGI